MGFAVVSELLLAWQIDFNTMTELYANKKSRKAYFDINFLFKIHLLL